MIKGDVGRCKPPEWATVKGDQRSGPFERFSLWSDLQGHQPAGPRTVTQQTDAQHSDLPQPQWQQSQGGC